MAPFNLIVSVHFHCNAERDANRLDTPDDPLPAVSADNFIGYT